MNLSEVSSSYRKSSGHAKVISGSLEDIHSRENVDDSHAVANIVRKSNVRNILPLKSLLTASKPALSL